MPAGLSWAAVGGVFTAFGVFLSLAALAYRLGRRTESADRRGKKLRTQETAVERVEETLEAHGRRLDAISDQVEGVDRDVKDLQADVNQNEERIQRNIRAVHDILSDGESCANPACPICYPDTNSTGLQPDAFIAGEESDDPDTDADSG